SDEHLHPRRRSLAGNAAGGTEQQRIVCCIAFHAEGVRTVGGAISDRPGHDYGVCFSFFVDAWLFTGSVCCGERRQLLQSVRKSPSGIPVSTHLAARLGRRRRGFLLS